jgi:hypothetical protein
VKNSILILFVLLFAVSADCLAQQSNVAKDVFDKWKQKASARDVSKLGFALSVASRRTGDETAEIDLWVVGRTPEAMIDVQPLYSEKLPNGKYSEERTEAGAVTKTSVAIPGSRSNVRGEFGLKIVVPVKPNANTLEIEWVGYAGGKIQNRIKVTIFLRDEPSSCLTTITGGR